MSTLTLSIAVYGKESEEKRIQLEQGDSFSKFLSEVMTAKKGLTGDVNSNDKLFGVLYDEEDIPILMIEELALKPIFTYSEIAKMIKNTVE